MLTGMFLLSCTSSSNVSSEKVCVNDVDCVPASCCHAKEVVNSAHTPNCKGMMCTMNCELGTLDCGQAEIKCVSKQCTFYMN